MANRKKIYEGKAKILYKGPRPGTLIQYFKDDATAFNNEKQGTITGKGVLNNTISEYLMNRLAEIGIPTHFIERLNMREQLIKEVEIIPIEVVVRNVAAGSICKRLNLEEGQPHAAALARCRGALQFGRLVGQDRYWPRRNRRRWPLSSNFHGEGGRGADAPRPLLTRT